MTLLAPKIALGHISHYSWADSVKPHYASALVTHLGYKLISDAVERQNAAVCCQNNSKCCHNVERDISSKYALSSDSFDKGKFWQPPTGKRVVHYVLMKEFITD